MKIWCQGVGETVRTCALLMLGACGGAEFQGSTIVEPDWPDVRRDAGGDVLGKDAGDVVDAGAELELEGGDAGDVVGELDQADAGEARACDLAPCDCRGVYLAICCAGPCPPGFEGLSCYCGNCKFGESYDAGHCF